MGKIQKINIAIQRIESPRCLVCEGSYPFRSYKYTWDFRKGKTNKQRCNIMMQKVKIEEGR